MLTSVKECLRTSLVGRLGLYLSLGIQDPCLGPDHYGSYDPQWWPSSSLRLLSRTKFYVSPFNRPIPLHMADPNNRIDRKKSQARLRESYSALAKCGLSRSTAVQLLDRPIGEILLIERIWTAVMDNLWVSSPEEFYRDNTPSLRKYFRWIVSNALYNPDRTISLWKQLAAYVTFCGAGGIGSPPLVERGVLGFDNSGTFVSTGIIWLDHVVRRGVKTKSEATRLAAFASTRGFPPGSATAQAKALKSHKTALGLVPKPLPSGRVGLLTRLGEQIGRDVKTRFKGKRPETDPGHVSLNSSGCVEFPRSEGGKAAALRIGLKLWCEEEPLVSQIRFSPIGHKINEVAGRPRWTTVRLEGDGELDIDPLEWIENPVLFEPYLDPKSRMPFPVYAGLNRHTGLWIFQSAADAAVSRGVLTDSYSLGLKVPQVEVAVVPEPGNKSRIVTKTEWWCSTYLQPFGHFMNHYLGYLPSARAGLTSAYQGFEWCKDAQYKKYEGDQSKLKLLSSDLSEATDHCNHQVVRAVMRGFLLGLGFRSQYLDSCIDLLASPREVVYPDEVLRSRNGILMGDPGCKSALTLINLVAEREAAYLYQLGKIRVREIDIMVPLRLDFRHFACAGDDHIAVGPLLYLTYIGKCHTVNRMKISKGKHFPAEILAKYCEEFIIRTKGMKLFGNKLFDSYEGHNHVDCLKVRLLSKEVKGTDVRDDRNPAPGKGAQLFKQIQWGPPEFENFYKFGVSSYFVLKLRNFISDLGLLVKLPIQLGGLGFCPDSSKEDWVEVMSLCSPNHLLAIQMVAEGVRLPVLMQALASIGTRSSARGVENRSDEEHLCFFFHSFAAHNIGTTPDYMGTFPSMEEALVPDFISKEEYSRLRYRDRVTLLKKSGFEVLQTLISEFNRPTLFQQLLSGETEVKDWRCVPFLVRLERMERGLRACFNRFEVLPELDLFKVEEFLQRYGTSDAMGKLLAEPKVFEIDTIEKLLDGALKHFINNVDVDLDRHNVPDSLRVWLKPYLERYAVHVRHPDRGALLLENVKDDGLIEMAPPDDAEEIGQRVHLLPLIRANKPILRLPMEPIEYRE